MHWKDVHSQSWPMTPDESQFGYTPTYLRAPLLARPYGAPLGAPVAADTMAGRSKRARRRRAKKRARALAWGGAAAVALPVATTAGAGVLIARAIKKRRAKKRRLRKSRRLAAMRRKAARSGDVRAQEWIDAREMAQSMSGVVQGLTVAELSELQALEAKKRQGGTLDALTDTQRARYLALTSRLYGTSTSSTKSTVVATETARAEADAVAPIWRQHGAEQVPSGRDPETYYRSLGYSRGDARRIAEHWRTYPSRRGERRELMDRLAAPMERRMARQASGGRDFGAAARGVGDFFGGLFGRRAQTAQPTFDFSETPAPAPESGGMSPLLIAGIAAAGLGAAYLFTQS